MLPYGREEQDEEEERMQRVEGVTHPDLQSTENHPKITLRPSNPQMSDTLVGGWDVEVGPNSGG